MDEDRELRQLLDEGVSRWRGPSPDPASARYARRRARRPVAALTMGAAAVAGLAVIVVAGAGATPLRSLLFTPAAEHSQGHAPGEGMGGGGQEPAPAARQEPTAAPRHEPTPAPRHEPAPAVRHEPTPAPKHEPTPTPRHEPASTPGDGAQESPQPR
jgi:outer membrane biosynthesis protein TonB